MNLEFDEAFCLSLMLDRVAETLSACEPDFPLFVTDNGGWYTTSDGNWCAGHWIGLLWLAAKRADDMETRQRFTTAARGCITRFAAQPLGHLFAGMNHHYAGFFGFDVDGDHELRVLGMRGADAMLELYDPIAEQIPVGRYRVEPTSDAPAEEEWQSWDLDHLAAVDVVHTSVPVLWRAYTESGAQTYYDAALAHTRRHIEWHLRADGSTTQLRPYDADTGVPGEPFNSLANDPGGCWSRGLAWSVAGLADAYVATGDLDFLDAIQRSMNYYLAHTESDLIPAWDLTSADRVRDSSAAAIIAYGLLRLAKSGYPGSIALQQLGADILGSLLNRCVVTDPRAANRGAVLHGCYRYPQRVAVDNELIWADFYTAAALDELTPA